MTRLMVTLREPSRADAAGIIIINPAIAGIKLGDTFLIPGRGGLIGVLLVAWFGCIVDAGTDLKKIEACHNYYPRRKQASPGNCS